MTKEQKLSLKKPDVLFLSFFGTGFAPFAPGTFGSFATLPLIVLIYFLVNSLSFKLPLVIALIVVLTVIACLVTDKIQKRLMLHDPQWIVIDEVLGMLITWCFTISISPLYLLLCFVIFRFFDIIKFWPASYFDRKIMHGSGTILDDIISGLYAGLLLKLLVVYYPNILAF